MDLLAVYCEQYDPSDMNVYEDQAVFCAFIHLGVCLH